MKALLILFLGLLLTPPAWSRVTIRCDFADPAMMGKPMEYHWDIYNRISPMRNCNPTGNPNGGICVVRPLGGKSAGGRMLIDEDTYKFDGSRYYYDWEPLKKQLGNAKARGRIHQLLLDNPSWAFQRGVDRAGHPEIETYGNAWPPNDPEAWAKYIAALMEELIKTYGRQEVEGWRYCIGREIGTSGHWRASKEDFFKHYANTVRAVKRVLPDAKVGSHFLWASSKHSWGPDFVAYCKEHKLPYDFVGMSFYPFYNRMDRVDLENVYAKDIAPIKDRPDWNPKASFEIHEYALIVTMGGKGSSYESAPPEHQASFAVMLQKMMYEHGVSGVFQWGKGPSTAATTEAFLPMKGDVFYSSSKEGEPENKGSLVGAVFAKNSGQHRYSLVSYNYNANPKSQGTEPMTFKITLPEPGGKKVTYRVGTYQKEGDRLVWSDWTPAQTTAPAAASRSELVLTADLPVFSFLKYEIVTDK